MTTFPTSAAATARSILFVAFATTVVAQPTAPAPRSPARAYAPALWLGQEEPFYPVLPHPFAFDGIDNDGDGKVDLADPDEIDAFSRSEFETPAGRAAHSRALRRVFGRLLDVRSCVESVVNEALPRPAARRCAEEQESDDRIKAGIRAELGPELPLLRFRTCGSLWNRTADEHFRCGPDAVMIVADRRAADWLRPRDVGATRLAPAPGGPHSGALSAIQYWMYYPWDASHIDDGEHVSVFFWPGMPAEGNRDVKGVVGAGHNGHTANNILIASKDETRATLSPRSLPRHMPILVELGKHASAPDFNCNGRYDMGVDSNVAPRGSWGSRDTLVSIESKDITPFRGWMSVERDGSGFLVEQSALEDKDLSLEWQGACPEYTRGREVVKSVLSGEAAPVSTRGVAVASHTYRLVDGDLLRGLMDVIRTGNGPDIVRELSLHREALWGSDRAPSSIELGPCEGPPADRLCIGEESLAALRTWSQHPSNPTLRARRDVWNHGDYERFDKDFKRHLFKQIGLGLAPRIEDGNFTLGVLARFSGISVLRDSSVDLGVYFDNINDNVARRYDLKRASISDVSITYNAFRTSYYGIFGGLSWKNRYSEFESVILHGASEKATVVERKLDRNVTAMAGVALTLSKDRSRLTFRAGATAPLRRGSLPDASAHRSFPRVGLMLSLEFILGFRNETHPLAQ